MDEKLAREFDQLKSAIMATAMFIASILRKMRIIMSRGTPTACVSNRGSILVNPDYWMKIDTTSKAWVLSHEMFHPAWRDHARVGKRNRYIWNLATDAVNNELLRGMIKEPLQKDYVLPAHLHLTFDAELRKRGIELDRLKQMGKEELYRVLSEFLEVKKEIDGTVKATSKESKNQITVDFDIRGKQEQWGEREDEGILQEGEPELFDNGEELDERWKEEIAKAYSQQKQIGRVPEGLRRLVDSLIKPKIDWRSVLRQSLKSGLGKTIVSTYKRPSRRFHELPGIYRFTLPRTHILVDTSGSIGEEELNQFVSEAYSIAGMSEISVICWDADAYSPIEARGQQEVVSKVLKELRGGGGTVIGKALSKTLQRMKQRDAAVILTDGYIFDMGSPETLRLLSEVASKSCVSIFCTTGTEHQIEGWTMVKIG